LKLKLKQKIKKKRLKGLTGTLNISEDLMNDLSQVKIIGSEVRRGKENVGVIVSSGTSFKVENSLMT